MFAICTESLSNLTSLCKPDGKTTVIVREVFATPQCPQISHAYEACSIVLVMQAQVLPSSVIALRLVFWKRIFHCGQQRGGGGAEMTPDDDSEFMTKMTKSVASFKSDVGSHTDVVSKSPAPARLKVPSGTE